MCPKDFNGESGVNKDGSRRGLVFDEKKFSKLLKDPQVTSDLSQCKDSKELAETLSKRGMEVEKEIADKLVSLISKYKKDLNSVEEASGGGLLTEILCYAGAALAGIYAAKKNPDNILIRGVEEKGDMVAGWVRGFASTKSKSDD
ncbi:MAG: hypothetical protein LBP36_00290 [Oscillospiraceae bacterium]|jgi:hypothetical protein|nr:hypothetical protein [Oscillospiraceae bacterium]